MSTLRTYRQLKSRKPLNRVSPKKSQPKGDWHPQVIRLEGPALTMLYDKVFARCGGICECGQLQIPPVQCLTRVSRFRDDPHHIIHRSKGGADTEENILWVNRDHHDRIHGVPNWSKRA